MLPTANLEGMKGTRNFVAQLLQNHASLEHGSLDRWRCESRKPVHRMQTATV
jgi:hypothetical protein